MPLFLELSLLTKPVEVRPVRYFCIRADASFSELREAILELTGWTAMGDCWEFVLPFAEGGEEVLGPVPPHVRHLAAHCDPDVIPISSHFDPANLPRQGARYHQEPSARWAVHVVALGSWNVLDARRRWLVHAENPWPPFEVDGPLEYNRLCRAALYGSDTYTVQSLAWSVFQWSPDLDVEELERRFDGG